MDLGSLLARELVLEYSYFFSLLPCTVSLSFPPKLLTKYYYTQLTWHLENSTVNPSVARCFDFCGLTSR